MKVYFRQGLGLRALTFCMDKVIEAIVPRSEFIRMPYVHRHGGSWQTSHISRATREGSRRLSLVAAPIGANYALGMRLGLSTAVQLRQLRGDE